MPDHLNAFQPGEQVLVADEAHMRAGLQRYRNREEVIAALLPYEGQRLWVTRFSYPHGAGVYYMLEGIPIWVWEECLIDWLLILGDPQRGLACEFYDVALEVDGGEQFVTIRDRQGRLFSKTWRLDPEYAVEAIFQTAQMRSRIGFEERFGIHPDCRNERPPR